MSDLVASQTGWNPRDGKPGTRLVGALTVLPQLIRRLGIEAAPVLAEAGVSPDTLASPSSRIAWESAARLLSVAVVRSGCAHFGLLCGREWHLADLGLLGELVRHSATVDAALRELVVNHHLNSEGALIFQRRRDDAVDLGYAIYVPFIGNTRDFYDGFLAAAANFMRELCGESWRPLEVFFPHSAPTDLAPYRNCFRAPLRFDSEFCAIRVSAKWLGRAVLGADAGRLRIAQANLATADNDALCDRVYRALRVLLLYGTASGNDLADTLIVHRRTLNRRLRNEGVTFQQVLDQVRFAIAKELLEQSELTLPEIASALGYAHSVSVVSAFRRWTGTTPGAWKQSARKILDPD